MTSLKTKAILRRPKLFIGLGFATSLLFLALSWPLPCQKNEPTVLCDGSPSSKLLEGWWNILQDPKQTSPEVAGLDDASQRATLAADLRRAEAAVRWVACYVILLTSLSVSLLSVIAILLQGARRGYLEAELSTKLAIACAWFPAFWWISADVTNLGPGGRALFPALLVFIKEKIEPNAFPLLRLSDGMFAAMLLASAAFILLIWPRRHSAEADQPPVLEYLQRSVTLLGGLFSLALVAVLIHARVVLLWPVATTGGCKDDSTGSLAAYCGMTDGMIFVYGAVATLMVGIAVVGSAAIVQARISDAAYYNRQNTAWDGSKLETKTWDIAVRLISIAAPMLFAPLSEALGPIAK